MKIGFGTWSDFAPTHTRGSMRWRSCRVQATGLCHPEQRVGLEEGEPTTLGGHTERITRLLAWAGALDGGPQDWAD
jgi:hypothetical protein